jgi:hypothetical protein
LRRIIQALAAELGLSEDFLPETLDEASAEDVTILLSTALKATRAAPEAASPPTPTRGQSQERSREEAPPAQADETQAPPQPTHQAGQPSEQPTVQTAEWEEVEEEHPAPTYGLESPVISHLLSTWTTDANKVTNATQ